MLARVTCGHSIFRIGISICGCSSGDVLSVKLVLHSADIRHSNKIIHSLLYHISILEIWLQRVLEHTRTL